MLIQLQLQNLAILKLELELLAIEPWIVLVDNPVVIGTDDNDVRVIFSCCVFTLPCPSMCAFIIIKTTISSFTT